MERQNRKVPGLTLLTVVAAIAFSLPVEAAQKAASFNSSGEMLIPADYRQWVFVGAPVTPHDLNNGQAAFPEFHHVYIDPASYAAYRKTGKFPDGTVLVKELVTVGAKSSSSGNGYFAGEFLGIAVSVKDSKRFAQEPGYWGYFNFMGDDGKALTRAKAQPTAACNVCHQNMTEDWVFTQHYPVLRAAKAKK